MRIANLTQHEASDAQIKAGVIEPTGAWKSQIRNLLTFDEMPTADEILRRAAGVAKYAKDMGCEGAMIGGAPYLMSALENALRFVGVTPLYAFSIRKSEEKHLPDGTVQKSQVFEHIGFVEAPMRQLATLAKEDER